MMKLWPFSWGLLVFNSLALLALNVSFLSELPHTRWMACRPAYPLAFQGLTLLNMAWLPVVGVSVGIALVTFAKKGLDWLALGWALVLGLFIAAQSCSLLFLLAQNCG